MDKNKLRGHLALFVAYVIFGLNIPISRSIIPDIVSPLALTYFRMSGAMVLFWLLSLFTKREKVPLRDVVLLFFASIFALVLNQTSFIVGLSMTTPIDASIIQTVLPIISMFLAAIVLKEPITRRKTIGVLIGLTGALLLILRHAGSLEGNRNLLGNVIVLGGVVSFGLYLTLFKGLIQKYSPVTLMKWMFLFAAIMNLPFSYRAVVETDYAALSMDSWWRVGFVVVLSTFITYLLIPVGQKVLRPTAVSMYNYLQPVTSSMAGVAMGLDVFGVENILSAVLVFTGVYVVTTSKSRADLEKKKEEKKKKEKVTT